MSYKDRAAAGGADVQELDAPKLSCVRCQGTRKTTTLMVFGGMCEQCFGDYCRKPFQIPRRKEAA